MHVYSSRNKSLGMFQFFPPYWSLRAISGWLRKRKKGLKSSDLCHYADTASKIKGETVTYKTVVSSFWKHSIGCNRFFLLLHSTIEYKIGKADLRDCFLAAFENPALPFLWLRNLAIWVLEFGKANKTHSSWLTEIQVSPTGWEFTLSLTIHSLSCCYTLTDSLFSPRYTPKCIN